MSQPKSESKESDFWTLDNGYKKTIKRTEDGRKMVNFLKDMIDERASVEKAYSKSLNRWYLKWMKKVDKCTEYGSSKEMLKKTLLEADRMSDIHTSIRDNLTNLTHSKIKNFKKENYSFQLCLHKPASVYKKNFEKAQKPWKAQSKKLELLNKELFSEAQKANDMLATPPDPQNRNQWKDQCDLQLRKVDNAKERVRSTENELSSFKETYITDMNNVFASAQEFETRRLDFFKEILTKFHDSLRSSKDNSTVNEVYSSCMQSISKADPRNDVKTWSSAYGPEASMPRFDRKNLDSPLFESLEERRKNYASTAVVSAVTKAATPATVQATISPTNNINGDSNKGFIQEGVALDQPDSEYGFDPVDLNDAPSKASTLEVKPVSTVKAASSSRQEYDMEVYSTLDEDNMYMGMVTALYDFDGKEEDDELSFKKGDTFKKLKQADSNGWATGMRNGKIGLFPDTYVN